MQINYNTKVSPLVKAQYILKTANNLMQDKKTKKLAAVADDVYQMMKTKGNSESFVVEDMMHDFDVEESEYVKYLPVLVTLGLVKLS